MIFMVCWQTSKAVIGAFTVRSPAPGILRNVAGLWCGVSLGLAASLLCNVCFTGVMLQIYVSDSTKVFCLFAGWPHLPAFLMTLWSEALILWRVLYGICFFWALCLLALTIPFALWLYEAAFSKFWTSVLFNFYYASCFSRISSHFHRYCALLKVCVWFLLRVATPFPTVCFNSEFQMWMLL